MFMYKIKANMARVLHDDTAKFQKDFFAIVQYSNMFAMTSGASRGYHYQFSDKAEWKIQN